MKYLNRIQLALLCIFITFTVSSQTLNAKLSDDLTGTYKGDLSFYANHNASNNFNAQQEQCIYQVTATLSDSEIHWYVTSKHSKLNRTYCDHKNISMFTLTSLTESEANNFKFVSFRIPLFIDGPYSDVSLFQSKNNELRNYYLRFKDKDGNSFTASAQLYKVLTN